MCMSGSEEVRVELCAGILMDEPPAGARRAILRAYKRHCREIRKRWEAIHGPVVG